MYNVLRYNITCTCTCTLYDLILRLNASKDINHGAEFKIYLVTRELYAMQCWCKYSNIKVFRCNIYKRLRVSKQSFTIISHDVLHGVKIHYFALVSSKNLGPRCELVGEICPHLGYYLRVTTHVVDFFKVRDIIWRPVAYKKKMYNLQVNALWKIGFSFIQGFLGSCSKRDTTLAGLSFYYLFFGKDLWIKI